VINTASASTAVPSTLTFEEVYFGLRDETNCNVWASFIPPLDRSDQVCGS
jgi:hypothetical protein